MPVGYTLDGMAEDTYAVMRALELPPVFLLGTSQGGMIAMGLASKHPDAVRGLALASTACRVKPAFAQIYRHWVDLAKKGEALALATDFICRVYSDHIPLEIKASLIEANGNADRATLSRFAAMTESIDGLSEIICGGISCPVFVVGAESDRVFSQGETEELAKRLNAPCYLYRDGYGHAVYDETPDAHKRICAFFQSVRDGDYVQ